MKNIAMQTIEEIIELHESGMSIAEIADFMKQNIDWEVAFWIEKEALSVLSSMYRNGATDEDVLEFMRKTGFKSNAEQVFDKLMENDTFRISRSKGVEWADGVVENALYMKAKGYYVNESKEVIVEGEKVKLNQSKYIAPSHQAHVLWLSNRKGDKWKVKTDSDEPNEGKAAQIMKELAKTGLKQDIQKLRNMKATGNYSDEYMDEKEKFYLMKWYDDVIPHLYSDKTVEEVIEIALKG